jgi:hypothetical protein
MLIQCTQALLNKMKITKDELAPREGFEYFPNSLKAWHANIVNIDRRKAVILMNNETRYTVVIYRPKPKDFTRMKELIKDAIITALRMEGIREDVINRYMADAGGIMFSKTANRSMVAKMNNAVHEVEFMQEYLDESTPIQRYISIVVGRAIQNSLRDEWFIPIEKLIKCLDIYCGKDKNGDLEDVLDVDLYQLRIKINMNGFDIWRRVLVPSTYSFRHLHNIIQVVFDWHNYHLHEFMIEKKGVKTKLIVMDDDPETLEWLNFDAYDILQERFVSLKDIFPECEEVIYRYDFGDSWEHTITLEKIIKTNVFKATYLEGRGERPPEDVGGSLGYIEYMRIMADDTDPEYVSMKTWSESQRERKLSPEKINDQLRRCINGYRYSPLYY